MSNTNTISLEEDTRIIRRNIAKGFLSPVQAEKDQKGLPDMADMAEYLDPTASDEEEEGEEDLVLEPEAEEEV